MTDGGDEPLSAYMVAYTATDQDEAVVLAGRVELAVPPVEIIRGDLVSDEGRWKEVGSVDLPRDESGTYVYFIEATPGYKRLEYPDLRERVVWRRLAGDTDDVG